MTVPFDAVLLLSFGGPEGPDEVMPFLENVTRGRGIPRERLEAVAEHYLHFGGRSPINDECRALIQALEAELAEHGPHLPVYWGNRNWHPMLADTLACMADDGVKRAVALVTSAYSSYSACRQYLDDIEKARAAVGERAPLVEKIPPYWNHPGFLTTMMDNTRAALGELAAGTAARAGETAAASPASETAVPAPRTASETAAATGEADLDPACTRLVFTAHSVPMAMAETCDYVAELREASAIVAAAVAPRLAWDLVWQSRSGPPSQPWLEPDVCDHLRTLAGEGVDAVVLVPIGFVADHMEVKYDLDTEARAVTVELGMKMTRAKCVGSAPRFVAGLRDLLVAHIEGRSAEALGDRGARPTPCAPNCCAYTPARPR